MRSSKSEKVAGFCRQCNSSVLLANGLYFCQCGSASDKSYYFPPSWVFKLGSAGDAPGNRSAKAASGKQLG